MDGGRTIRRLGAAAAGAFLVAAAAGAQTPVVLDRVVAVVNRQAILASDVEDEVHLAAVDPEATGAGPLNAPRALDQLISRALIEQQIRQEEAQSLTPSETEVEARLNEIRRELPACEREKCTTGEGWSRFLATRHLTQEGVEAYLRNRTEILRFIEQRFRAGIRISPQEVETYYRETLVPLYSPGDAIPPLDKVSERIGEILLQREVNSLFDDWLKNLRSQGSIEVLDPAFETDAKAAQ